MPEYWHIYVSKGLTSLLTYYTTIITEVRRTKRQIIAQGNASLFNRIDQRAHKLIVLQDLTLNARKLYGKKGRLKGIALWEKAWTPTMLSMIL